MKKIPIHERNQFIIERRRNGNTLGTIADEFRISTERVRQIVSRAGQREREARESQELLKAIQDTNDLDRPVNRDALLTAIQYPPRVRHVLNAQLHPDKEEITLRELMDWCMPKVTNNSDNLYDWVPGYRIYGFGKYCVGDLIRYIDRLNLGEAFGKEWTKRRDAFRAKFCEEKVNQRRGLM